MYVGGPEVRQTAQMCLCLQAFWPGHGLSLPFFAFAPLDNQYSSKHRPKHQNRSLLAYRHT